MRKKFIWVWLLGLATQLYSISLGIAVKPDPTPFESDLSPVARPDPAALGRKKLKSKKTTETYVRVYFINRGQSLKPANR